MAIQAGAFLALLKRNPTPPQRFQRHRSQFHFSANCTFDFVQNSHQRELGANSSSASRIRSDVWPSQRGGWRNAFFAEPFSAAVAALIIFVVSVPTTTLVPISTVMGRSVFSRSVRQGMPRAVVSS